MRYDRCGMARRTGSGSAAAAIRNAIAIGSAVMLASCGGGSGTSSASDVSVVKTGSPSAPLPDPTPTPTPTATPAPTTKSLFGINASAGNYFSYERIWANLAYRGSEWFQQDPADTFRADGYPNRNGRIFLNIPQAVFTGAPTKVTCTWKGAGKIFMDGDRTEQSYGDHVASVVWKRRSAGDPRRHLPQFLRRQPGRSVPRSRLSRGQCRAERRVRPALRRRHEAPMA